MRQFLVLIAAGFDTLYAAKYGGGWCMMTVAGAGGWAICQYDDKYQRALANRQEGESRGSR